MDFFRCLPSFNNGHKKTIIQNLKEETGGAYRTPASINKPEKNYVIQNEIKVRPRGGYLL